MELGQYIKGKRKEKKLTLREAAKLSGVSHPYLSQLENGRNDKPSPDILNKIAKGLNIPNGDLLMMAGYIEDPFSFIDLNSTKWETATTDQLQEEMRKQQELTGDLEDVLTGNFIVTFRGKVLTDKDKQKLMTLIETILD